MPFIRCPECKHQPLGELNEWQFCDNCGWGKPPEDRPLPPLGIHVNDRLAARATFGGKDEEGDG